ncbi:DUF5977 domain-containing protein [Chryseobacterium echinoideorum]|uniref:DUF5977 domain-containing protein n=1 Tax=Chryseobacterium echinoideorum TaxID=1549648 RepID=UPI0016259968|nr:DUF5977 domain-containing protein [Chryseobacterium echinoideorum]
MPKDIKSPDASLLAKYVETPPISAYGQAAISLPLLEDNVEGIPMNLNLNYDTSGLRINNPGGVVGQNWSLSSGGVITRTIKDIADESKYEITEQTSNEQFSYIGYVNVGFLFNGQKMNFPIWNNQKLQSLAEDQLLNSNLQYRIIDSEPDEFTFNFLGKSGKFYMGHDGQWKVSSNDNISIEINSTDLIKPHFFFNFGNHYVQQAIGKITLRDDQGNEYIFGSDNNSIEYSCSFYAQYDNDVFPSSWYLKEVRNRNGKTILNFEYERGKPIIHLDGVGQSSSAFVNIPSQSGSGATGTFTLSDTGINFAGGGSLISPVYLKQINYNNNTTQIYFNYSKNESLYYFTEPMLSYFYINHSPDGYYYWNNRFGLFFSNFYQNLPIGIIGQSWSDLEKFTERKKLDKIKIVKTVTSFNIGIDGQFAGINNAPTHKEFLFNYVNNPVQRLFLNSISMNANDTNGIQDQTLAYKFQYNTNGTQNHNGTDLSTLNNFQLTQTFLPNLLWRGIDSYGYYNSYTNYNRFEYGEISNRETKDNDLVYIGMLNTIFYPTGGFDKLIYERNTFGRNQEYSSNQIILMPATGITGGTRIKSITKVPDFNKLNYTKKTYLYQNSFTDQSSSGFLEFKPVMNYSGFNAKVLHCSNGSINFSNCSVQIFSKSINPLIPVSNSTGGHILYDNVIEVDEAVENGNLVNKGYIQNKYTSHNDFIDKSYTTTLNQAQSMFDPKNSKAYKRGLLKERTFFNSSKNILRKEEYYYRTDNVDNMFARAATINTKSFAFTGPYYTQAVGVAWATGYDHYIGDYDLIEKTTTDYLNGQTVVQSEKYYNKDYPSSFLNGNAIYSGSRRNVKNEVISADGQIVKNKFDYEFNCTNGDCTNRPFGLISSTRKFKNNKLIDKEKLSYRLLNSNINSYAIDYYEKYDIKDTLAVAQKINFTQYDPYGNLIELKENDDKYTSYIYDERGQFLRSKVVGLQQNDFAQSVANIRKSPAFDSQSAQTFMQNPNSYMESFNNELILSFATFKAAHPQALISTYTQDVKGNLYSESAPNGINTYYQYDKLDRLAKVKDKDGKILKEYKYNYTTNNSGNYPFLFEEITNEERKFLYLRNNCTNGQIGDIYLYTVPAGTYKSLISANDLGTKVWNDVNQNGQNHANLYGNCISPSSYGFTGLSTIQLHTSNLSLNGNTVSGYLVFTVLPTYNRQEGSYIAYIPTNLAPTSDRNFSYHETSNGVDRYWSFLVKSNGYVFATVNGADFEGSAILINSFQYDKN